jgi:hypothetical protein
MPGRVFYLWQVRSFTVRVDLNLVDSLNQALADPRHKQGYELGGILLGRILAPGEVEVTDFEFVQSEHRRGAIYDLGLREQSAFARRVASLGRRSRLKPVGFFRTHVRRGLFLDQDDFSLMTEAFSDPSQIALVIRPVEPGPANAGIFLWEDGDIDRRQTPLLFPFDTETLRTQGPIAQPFETVPATPKREPLRLPAIPVRWIAWGGTAAAGALALSAALPHLHVPNRRPVKPTASLNVARNSAPKPAPAVSAPQAPEPTPEIESAVTPEPPPEPAAFVAPKPDEGAQSEPPRAFVAPRRQPVDVEPRRVAVAAPPPLPPLRVAATPPSVPVLPDVPPRQVKAAPRERSVRVAVNIEQRESSEIRRVTSRLPLLGHLSPFHAEGGSRFSPASPNHPLEPRVPVELVSCTTNRLQ